MSKKHIGKGNNPNPDASTKEDFSKNKDHKGQLGGGSSRPKTDRPKK